jgi:hypothetical protein
MKELISSDIGFKRYAFFVVGIIATIAYRIIIVLEDFYLQVAWYVGTIGFILYFGHRARVQGKRRDLVLSNDLISYVERARGLKKKQKEALCYIVKTSATSKARINSLAIFWLSVLALVVGLVKDFVL